MQSFTRMYKDYMVYLMLLESSRFGARALGMGLWKICNLLHSLDYLVFTRRFTGLSNYVTLLITALISFSLSPLKLQVRFQVQGSAA